MGTCFALHAAKKCDPLREPVVLIEKERLGGGSSGQSSGVVFQSYRERAMAGMARDALKVYAGFESTNGRSVGFRRTGVLTLASPERADLVSLLEAGMTMQESIGIQVRRLDEGAIAAQVAGIELAPGTIGAFEPDGGFIDPARTIDAFTVLARWAGAVTRVGVRESSVLVENGKVAGVTTREGVFRAPIVVLAAGPWTVEVLAELGVSLPLRLVQTDQHAFAMPPAPQSTDEDDALSSGEEDTMSEAIGTRAGGGAADRRPVPHPVIFDLDRQLYARCEPQTERTRVGRISFGGAEALAPGQEPAVRPEQQAWARESLGSLLPVYRDLPLLESRAYRLVVTADLRPIVGPVPGVEGLYVVAGFTGNDFQLAPSIGEGLAQMVLGQPISAFDPAFFSPERFA